MFKPETTLPKRLPIGGDQARQLRALVVNRSALAGQRVASKSLCQTIAVAGGKGGVGRSVIALNLATAFAQQGAKVGLLDMSSEFGSIEFLAGMNGYWNLSHVIQGCRRLGEVIHVGPAGVQILSGGNSLLNDRGQNRSLQNLPFEQLKEFEQQLDWLIIDASGGVSSAARSLVESADDLVVVAAPEPVAVAEAYATVKSYANSATARLGLCVNYAESETQAQKILDCLQQAAYSFLKADLHRRGYLPFDRAVSASVLVRLPFVLGAPESDASRAIIQFATHWTKVTGRKESDSFFERLQRRHRTFCEMVS